MNDDHGKSGHETPASTFEGIAGTVDLDSDAS
jgi:hypothetical protein